MTDTIRLELCKLQNSLKRTCFVDGLWNNMLHLLQCALSLSPPKRKVDMVQTPKKCSCPSDASKGMFGWTAMDHENACFLATFQTARSTVSPDYGSQHHTTTIAEGVQQTQCKISGGNQ